MHAIGIDMSLLHTGCVEIDEKLRVKRWCLIEPKSKGYPRVLEIADAVIAFVRDRSRCGGDYECVIGVEDYIIGKGFKIGMDILRAQGSVVSSLREFDGPCYFIHPARLRHFQIKHQATLIKDRLSVAGDLVH